MKKKQRLTQIILISIGLILFVLTYLYYPNIKKENLAKDKPAKEEMGNASREDVINTFENIEYKGLYDFDKPFKVTSDNAYILSADPNIVYMKNMKAILYLNDSRTVIITSDEGHYNKETYDCYFEKNVPHSFKRVTPYQ